MSLTTVDGNLISSGAITLTTQVTGTLPVANGGTGVTTSTGTGATVRGTSPTLTTPILGTPTSGNLANCTGIPAPAALSTASGSAPSYSARAWVNFNGTGTPAIRASGNVSSITDNGTGDYTVNFTTAMTDANYASNVTVKQDDAGGGTYVFGSYYAGSGSTVATVMTTTSLRVTGNIGVNTSLYDCIVVCVSVFR